MEFYTAMKKNEILSFASKWMKLENIILLGQAKDVLACKQAAKDVLAWPKRPKIICSPSHVDIRSRANTIRGLDFDHMIKWEHTREV
jgi:hypothetical protein